MHPDTSLLQPSRPSERSRNYLGLALLASIALTACAGKEAAKPEAQLVYTNANILTVDQSNAQAEAVAIRDGKILAVGGAKDIAGFIGANTKVVDLQGKTMIPGIYDAHSHFAVAKLTGTFVADLNSPPIGTVRNISDIVTLLKA